MSQISSRCFGRMVPISLQHHLALYQLRLVRWQFPIRMYLHIPCQRIVTELTELQIIAWVDRLPLTLESLPNEPQTNRKISMLLNWVTRSTDQGKAKVKLVTKRQNELKSDFARFATHLQTVCYFWTNILFAVYVLHLHVNTLNYVLIFYPSYEYYLSILSVVVLRV